MSFTQRADVRCAAVFDTGFDTGDRSHFCTICKATRLCTNMLVYRAARMKRARSNSLNALNVRACTCRQPYTVVFQHAARAAVGSRAALIVRGLSEETLVAWMQTYKPKACRKATAVFCLNHSCQVRKCGANRSQEVGQLFDGRLAVTNPP